MFLSGLGKSVPISQFFIISKIYYTYTPRASCLINLLFFYSFSERYSGSLSYWPNSALVKFIGNPTLF